MSANNYIKIDRRDYTVSDCDLENTDGRKIGQGKNLEDAIDIAKEYQKENIVEYGIQFMDSGLGQNDAENI